MRGNPFSSERPGLSRQGIPETRVPLLRLNRLESSAKHHSIRPRYRTNGLRDRLAYRI